MRYYVTTQGIARGSADGMIDMLDVAAPDLGAVLWTDPTLAGLAAADATATVALDDVQLLAPVQRPGKVVCMAINYQSHVDEVAELLKALGQEPPTEPVFFGVPSTAITHPGADIALPDMAPDQIDYEIELAAVIGRGGKNIAKADVWQHIAGLTLSNDVSARDLQAKAMTSQTHELAHAKGLDGFKPLGPALVTIDEFDTTSGPLDLMLETKVNGEVRQHESTADMLFDIPASVAYVSKFFTLEPGDLLLTGSPAGVGVVSRTFLKAGDVVELSATGIGSMTQRVTTS